MRRLLAIIVSLILITGGVFAIWHFQRGGVTTAIQDLAAMQAAIGRALPPGTPVKQARSFMEQEGFKCSEQCAKPLGDSGQLQDYLYCDRYDGTFVNPVK